MRNSIQCIAFIMIWMAVACSPFRKAPEPSITGKRLTFSLPDLDGNVVDSHDPRFTGKVVLVTLWATWCAPCHTEIPTFIEYQNEYGDRGLVVVGIAFEAEKDAVRRREALAKFGERHSMNYLVLDGGIPAELDTTLPQMQNVNGLPVEILINREGEAIMVRNGYGYSEEWAKNLRNEIENQLARTRSR